MVSYVVLFLSVAVGAAIMLYWQPRDRRTIKLLTAFGGAYILAVTCLHLLPEVFGGGIHAADREGGEAASASMGLWVLAGFFVQLILDYLSHGIEHGHTHQEGAGGQVPWGMLLGLCIHAYLEGTPLAHPSRVGPELALPTDVHNALLIGIVMHNVPVSIVLMSLLLHNGMNRVKALAVMTVFAVMSPLGMLTAESARIVGAYQHQLMAMVIGIFLHIATTILFETGDEHHFNFRKLLVIVAGAGLAILSSLVQRH